MVNYILDMDLPDSRGHTKRQSLMQVLQSTPENSKAFQSAFVELEECPEIPFYLQHIWYWFWEIDKGRQMGFNGPDPLTWFNIESWSRVTDNHIKPIEIQILKMIDALYLKHINQKNKVKTNNDNIPVKKPKKR